MKYIQKQKNKLVEGLSTGLKIEDVLVIKSYVQTLMAEKISSFLLPSSRVLEVGCGGSLTVHYLDSMGHDVIGVDRDVEMIMYSKLLKSIFNSDVNFLKCDAFDLPFDDSEFDYVYSVGLIEHYDLESQEKLISEMCRVSKNFIHTEIPNYHPLSLFYCTGLNSDEKHLRCNPGILLKKQGCRLIDVDGRGLFARVSRVIENPGLLLFLEKYVPNLLIEEYSSSDISDMCLAEKNATKEQRLTYGFQVFWISKKLE